MKYLFCLLVLLNFSNLFSQVNKDAVGSKPSVVLNGEDLVYHDSLLVAKYTYKNGVKNGPYSEMFYNSYGKLIFKETGLMVAGLKQGKAPTFMKAGGKLMKALVNNYVNGKLNGESMIMEGTDTLLEAEFVHGKINGEAYRQVWEEAFNTKDYSYFAWREFEESEYVMGVRHGNAFTVYDEVPSELGFYKHGLKDSVWKTYVTHGEYAGELQSVCTYVNGKKEGPAESFFKLVVQEVDGVETSGFAAIREYVVFKNGLMQGPYSLRGSDGDLVDTGNMVDGLRQGPWSISKWEDGKRLYLKGNMVNDKLKGLWFCYDSVKRLMAKLMFENDTLNGECLAYEANGVLSVKRVYDKGNVVALFNYRNLDGFKSIGVSRIKGKPNHLLLTVEKDYLTLYEEYRFLKDRTPAPDTLAAQYLNVFNGHYNDTFLVLDGLSKAYSHDTFVREQTYKMGHLNGVLTLLDYQQDIRLHRNFSNDTLIDEQFYFLDGSPFKGTFTLLSDSPPNREVIRIKKGRRKGYSEIYGRYTGNLLGRRKF